MIVLMNKPGSKTERVAVEVELVKELATCIYVRLPDGSVIKRKKNRDILPNSEEKK
jgi:hypothetical protein